MNYKSVFLFTALLSALFVQHSYAQCNSWAVGFSGSCYRHITGIVTDDSNNLYVTGYFCDSVTFGTTTLVTTDFYYGLFLCKYDVDGNLVFAKKYGETNNHILTVTPFARLTKSGSAIYIAGDLGDTMKIGNTVFASAGSDHLLFIVKTDLNGATTWKKVYYTNAPNLTGTYHEVSDVAQDGANGIVFGGTLQDTTDFGTVTLANGDISTAFLIRMNSAGTIIWTKQSVPGAGGLINAIAHGANGNIAVSGTYGDSIRFGAHVAYMQGVGYFAPFTALFDSLGNNLWVSSPTGSQYNSQAFGVTVDAAGNVYTGGFMELTLNFDGIIKTGVGNGEVFCVKYSPAGVAQWVTLKGPHYGTYLTLEWVFGMCGDAQGNTFISCITVDTSYFGSSVYYTVGTRDAAVWHVLPDGTPHDFFIASSGFFDTPSQPALDASGAVYVSVVGNGPFNFVNSNTTPSPLAATNALWKICPDYPNAVNEIAAPADDLKLFPNPMGDFTTVYLPAPLNTNAQLTITTVTGEVVRSEIIVAHETEKQLDLSALADGIYFVTLHNTQQTQNAKVVVMH